MASWNINNIAIGESRILIEPLFSLMGEDSSNRGRPIVHAAHELSKLRVSAILNIPKNRQLGYDKFFDIEEQDI